MVNNALSEVAEAYAHAEKELKSLEKALCGFVQLVVKEMSVERQDNEWCRIDESSRVKDSFGLKRALDEQDLPVAKMWEIDDIVGARAVVLLLTDVDALTSAIMASSALKLTSAQAKPFHNEKTGYRACHIKGRWNRGGRSIGCEIQIRTELQDAWAVVSRGELYKHGDPPPIVVQSARVQADHLALIDESFEQIKDMVTNYTIKPVSIDQSAVTAPQVLEGSE